MSTIVEAIDLRKTYMLGKVPVDALRGVNFKVDAGDFISILGPSGSGKSTLLNLIGALDKPTSGTLRVGGVDIGRLGDNSLSNVRLKIGFVFQFFNLIPRLSAKANVELAMSISDMSKAARSKRAAGLLNVVGLKDRMYHKPAELSGGQQQRVAIARALANKPKFLLLDEPTGNVDSKTAAEIIALIHKLNKENGVSVIMVTHDQKLASEARRTVYMVDGEIESDVVN